VSLPVITAPEADAQIRAIGDWWRSNRSAAPDLFSEELAHCFVLLAQAPMLGKPYRRQASIAGVRRALLRATRYHVYYVPRSDAVAVLAVWKQERLKFFVFSNRQCFESHPLRQFLVSFPFTSRSNALL
jgi:plasmid stabilization system protein ParE